MVQQEARQFIEQYSLPAWVDTVIDLPASDSLAEPLTPREQEVLIWLGRNYTVPKIAKELVVGENTVRSHIKKVYAKPDVHSRHEAIQATKELKLI